jgi:hypothetical protein
LISRDHEDLDKAWTELTAINDEYDSVKAGDAGLPWANLRQGTRSGSG